jgi:hypothetical protein
MRRGGKAAAGAAEPGIGGVVDLVGVPRRRRPAARVRRWVRFGGAGGPAITAALITAGATGQQTDEIVLGTLVGISWMIRRLVERDERSRRARAIRSAADPNVTPGVHFRSVTRTDPPLRQARLPRAQDPTRQPTRKY